MPRRRSPLILSDSGLRDHNHSLDLNGTDERLANLTDQAIGIANDWTISTWLKGDNFTDADVIWVIQNNQFSILNNEIRLRFVAYPDLFLSIRDTTDGSGTVKSYRYSGILPTGQWLLITATWNGTDMKLYLNGEFQEPTEKFLDGAVTMTDPGLGRSIAIGSNRAGSATTFVDGKFHQTGIWDTALTDLSITGLYLGKNFDWAFDRREYINSADLVHFWRHGFNAADIGEDSVGSIDIGDDAQNITSDDIVTDFPGAP